MPKARRRSAHLSERFEDMALPEELLATMAPECMVFALSNPDPEVHRPAAIAWTAWEAATVTLRPDPEFVASMTEPEAATEEPAASDEDIVDAEIVDDEPQAEEPKK